MDEYHISNIPQRFLMAQHYQSSMDQPNLQNVQAKLKVARQKNHELALQYFRNKYGSAVAYEDFAMRHNMGELVEQPTAQQALIRHLQRKAKQIQKKVHNQQSFEQQKQYTVHVKQPQWVKKHSKKANNNPWIKSNSPEKHKRNDTESSKYIDSAVAPKNKESQFISQFKNYLENKEKVKQEKKVEEVQDQILNRTSQSKMFSTSKVHNKSIVQSVAPTEKKKCYEEELAKKIFRDIIGECGDQSKVQKLALVEYIVKNKKILKVLGITEQALSTQIMRDFPTKTESQMTLQQLTFYILKAVGKQKQINQLKQQKRTKDVPQGCMLTKQMIIHFEKVFKQLDTYTDLIIKRLPFIQRLANDPLIKNQLNTPAVFEPQINRPVTLRRIFQRIQLECIFGSEEQQRVKEYISWNQFLDYFKSGYSPQSLYNMVTLVDSLHKSDAMGLVEVPDVAIDIIVQAVSKLQSRSGYFNTLSLIEGILQNPEYEHQKYTQVRSESRIAELPSQTFQQVLLRIKKNGQKFMTLKQFLEFFSAKGRPIQKFQQAKNNSARKNFSGVKVKFAGDQLKPKQQNIDGYDSDPQIYQSKVMNKNSPRKSGRSAKKLQQASSFIEQVKSKPLSRRQFKVTVPVPFSFEQRQRQRSKDKVLKNQNQIAENLKQFKARPIPEKVLQEGLYEKMLEEDKLKIEERRKSCMIMTLANERPFSFLNRKTNKKTKQQREQFVFKAKPIPWYCSVDLLQKKKEAEIVRNEKIAKEAQENLAKAKLPPRMERDFQQKQAKMANTEQQRMKRPESQPKVYRQPPNFDKLHREFQQGLQRRRKQNKTTKPQQFNFNHKNSKGAVPITSQSQEQFYKEQNKQKSDYRKIFESKPAAPSTAKFEQLVEKRRQQMDKKRKQEQQKRIEDEKWKKIDEGLKNKLLVATKNKENKQQEQKKQRQAEMKEQMKTFQEWKKKCVEKGRNQPMLIERPLKRDEKIEKMKKLYQISQTLKGNGIKGKDHDSYFKRQELLLLQDYEVLKTTLNQFGV